LTKESKSLAWSGYNNTFYEHFQLQVRDDDDPDDIADNNYDHVCDECRYYLVSHLSIGTVEQRKKRRIQPQTAGALF